MKNNSEATYYVEKKQRKEWLQLKSNLLCWEEAKETMIATQKQPDLPKEIMVATSSNLFIATWPRVFSQHNNTEYLKKLTNGNFIALLRRSKGNNLFNDMIESLATLLNITHLNRDVQYRLVIVVKGESPLSQILNVETYHQLRTNLDDQKPSRQWSLQEHVPELAIGELAQSIVCLGIYEISRVREINCVMGGKNSKIIMWINISNNTKQELENATNDVRMRCLRFRKLNGNSNMQKYIIKNTKYHVVKEDQANTN
jgi:hypothetical protein